MPPILSVNEISKSFGGLKAVDNVSVELQKGQIVSVIGPNGAGKTTLFNCISGFYRPDRGSVTLENKPIQKLPEYKIARLGMVRTFQHVRLFDNMTVLENLLVARHRTLNRNLLSGIFKTPKYRASEEEALEQAVFWLKRVDLLDVANREAANLAYGQQRRLEISRCMAAEPKVLLLDEPAAGLNPKETDDLKVLIRELRDQFDVSVVLIEHDMTLVMDISDYVFVINQGQPLANGTPDEVRQNPDVINAYLGSE